MCTDDCGCGGKDGVWTRKAGHGLLAVEEVGAGKWEWLIALRLRLSAFKFSMVEIS